MRIVIMADSHGDCKTVERIVEAHRMDADLFLHLGDGVAEFCRVMEQYPQKKSLYVVGNHEDETFHWNHFESTVMNACGHRIFVTHGDKLHAKLDTLELKYMGKMNGADMVLFGHTHIALDEERDGVRLINPGALNYPRDGSASYAVIDFSESGIKVQFFQVQIQA